MHEYINELTLDTKKAQKFFAKKLAYLISPNELLNKIEEYDEKIIAVAKKDPFLNEYNDISEVSHQISAEIKHFFEVYKQLEGKTTTIEQILGRTEAEKIIEECMERYNQKFEK